MSTKTSDQSTGLSFWNESPSKYNREPYYPSRDQEQYYNHLIDTLERPEVKFASAGDLTARALEAILPLLIAERNPTSLEFISTTQFDDKMYPVRVLRGAIIRDENQTVLLYVYGVGFLDDESRHTRETIFDCFGIDTRDQERIINTAWTMVEYSVMVDLTTIPS